VTLEANTFLSGDQPHAVSVWFNSSNLEANVSNTCVFSISDQEKLDSLNLDLQSNTWHNLTYAYQGEGGSRVTYLDGRKVAEDQAEDTFGDYPPFAMTGYSQGGYVVSASSMYGTSEHPYLAFDNNTNPGNPYRWISGQGNIYLNGVYDGTQSHTDVDGNTENGEWLKIEMPHKLKVSYFEIAPYPTNGSQSFRDYAILGSNDDTNWYQVQKVSGLGVGNGLTAGNIVPMGTYKNLAFKYFVFIWHNKANDVNGHVAMGELKLYGHRENDLVRLPDPTNVLKYPHISIPSSYTKRGYVVSASNDQYVYGANNVEARGAWAAFGNTGSEPGWQLYYDGSSNAPYASSADGSGFYQNNALASTLTGTSHRGEWIKLELPHKLMVQKMKTDHGSQPERLGQVILLGSNNDSDWYTIKDTFALTTASAQTTDINATVAYKYIVLIVKSLQNASINVDLKNLEYFGTGVDSIPIQIGGGNIDKVANFRVYDTFVGEDQALEIWDAQKDYFGRAKSSMTLQKGRLGLGTTEPQGRLAVLDEPHNLEEFPPRAMTAYKNYFEGHGEFCASGNSNGSTVYRTFAKNGNLSWTTRIGATAPGNPYYSSTGYTDPSRLTSGLSSEIPVAPYLLLELPYKIKLSKYEWQTGENSVYHITAGIREVEIWAQNTGDTTWKLVNASSTVTPTRTFEVFSETVNSNVYYNKYALIALRQMEIPMVL